MIKFICTANVYDELKGEVMLLPGLSSFNYTPFAAPIQYHRVDIDAEAPGIGEIIETVPQPESKVLFLDAGGRDDVHLVSEQHMLLAKKRKLAGIAVNGMVRGDTHLKLEKILGLFAIGRSVVPWQPAEEELAGSYLDEAASEGAWLVGDADAVMVISAQQAKAIGLRQAPRWRTA